MAPRPLIECVYTYAIKINKKTDRVNFFGFQKIVRKTKQFFLDNHLTHGLIKKDSTHRLRYPEVCVIAINYLTKSLSIAAITPTDRMEYAIASVCHHLQAVFLESKANLEIFRQKNQVLH